MIDLFTEHDTQKLIDYILENHNPKKPLMLFVDLFCGCGGVTEGYTKNDNIFMVACVNHDAYAIKSHHANYPYCIHYTEDIREWVVIFKIQSLISQLRVAFPNAIIGLHASLECTHFSKAKGGTSRDADSRTLANHLFKYLCINPDYITIENVEEFLSWGPLYQVAEMKSGLKKWKFTTKNKKNVWCDESYDKRKAHFDALELSPFLKPIPERKAEFYKAWVKEFEVYGFNYEYQVLNAADFGAYTSRKRYFGVFAANGLPINFPAPTHVTKNKHHLFPHLKRHNAVKSKLNLLHEGNSLFGLNKNKKPYVEATFERVYYGLLKFHDEGYFTITYNSGQPEHRGKSVNKPLGTILTSNTHSLVHPVFLSSYYGASKNGNGIHSLNKPCNTIATKDTFALHHLQYAYGKPTYSKITEPSQAITTNPKQELVTTKWLFDTQFKRIGNSVNKPCPTIIARQDKKPLYLASASNQNGIDNSITQPNDNEIKTKLRAFMREHGITDIKIRSLEVDELLRIQGFPEDYILEGGKTRAMKYIGNSVAPDMAEANAKALYEGLEKELRIAI